MMNRNILLTCGLIVMLAAFGAVWAQESTPPAEDWVLLRRLGIAPPAGELERDRYRQAATADGKQFRLRDGWNVEPVGETLATFAHNGAPALSRVPFGKGSVIGSMATAFLRSR